MFIRTVPQRKTGNRAVQVVESYRNKDGKPRQRILQYLGCAPEGPALDELLRLAELSKAQLQHQRRPALFPPEAIAARAIAARQRKLSRKRPPPPCPVKDMLAVTSEGELSLGVHEVFGTLYRQLDFGSLWQPRHRVSARIFRDALWMRLLDPGLSKRRQVLRLRDHGLDRVRVEQVYRMMDRLDDERVARLCSRVSQHAIGLLGGEVDVVFLDATTLSFASDVPDDLRKKGFSKDGKHQKVQVVLALLQSRDGLPLGYRLFPGDTTDVSTLAPLVEELKKEIRLRRVVVVADSGMASADNFAAMTRLGFDWVVAARLRRLPRTEWAALEAPETWAAHGGGADDDEAKRLRDHTVARGSMAGQRLVLRYYPKKARKDRADRDAALATAGRRLTKGVKGKGRAARYLRIRKGAVSLDRRKVAEDALFDGLHGVWTSLPDPPAAVRAHYAGLWRIEHSFRVLKSTLRVRPIFHWTARRVRAHIAICYLAFALLRILRWRFHRQHPTHGGLSEQAIIDALVAVRATLVRDPATNNLFLIPSRITQDQRMLYATVSVPLSRKTVLVPPSSAPAAA